MFLRSVQRDGVHLLLYPLAAGEKGLEKNLGIGKLTPFEEKMVAEASLS